MMRFLAAAVLMPLLSSYALAQAHSGDIVVSEAWSRATPGGARNGAAFMQITSKSTGDKLLKAKSDVAERVELHTHIHEQGVMRMRRVDAIEVPAGKTVMLQPGGYHVMLMDLKRPLDAGDKVDLTLVFEKAGEVAVTATVEPIGAKGPGSAAGMSHGAGHGQSHGSGQKH